MILTLLGTLLRLNLRTPLQALLLLLQFLLPMTWMIQWTLRLLENQTAPHYPDITAILYLLHLVLTSHPSTGCHTTFTLPEPFQPGAKQQADGIRELDAHGAG